MLRLLVAGSFLFIFRILGTSVVNASESLPLSAFRDLATFATIPTSCNNTCNDIQNTIGNCSTPECLCTSANEAALKSCVDCTAAVKPNQTVVNAAQNILEQFATLCDNSGISVPIETAAGFTGSVGLLTGTIPNVGTGVEQSSSVPSHSLTAPGPVSIPAHNTSSSFASSVTSGGISLPSSVGASTSSQAGSSTPASSSNSTAATSPAASSTSAGLTDKSPLVKASVIGSLAVGMFVSCIT
ncbi:hypothetical protein GYMLUDRAFT_74859 [Collybiopsis luxurians FD-317 M1]|uniref:Extracellular membrane protein CFEM domain-containing protein n=1 Tax=Collybiopsis luxurians FD-317 M1 TaxID=944289 RepID=A0A0D0C7Y6_9AGAR|nr:hypothetical protein GYMLUDRAFT_74859 [Collybiopsis luxurians FD-317 M1]